MARRTHTGATLADRVHRDLSALAPPVWQALLRRFPVLEEIAAATPAPEQRIVRPLAELLLDEDEVSGARLEEHCRRQVRELARPDRPQQVLVDLYDYAMSLIVAELWSRGGPGDYAELTELTGRAATVVDALHKAVVNTYWSQVRADRFGRHSRRALAHGLLAGRPTAEQVEHAGVAVADRYRVGAVRSAAAGGSWQAEVSEQLHERRVLHCVLAEDIVVFEPEDAPDVLAEVGHDPGLGEVAIGVAPPSPVPNLPTAVAEARRVADLALTVPLLGTVVSTEQLLLELTLLQDEDLAASMRALAEPIAARPDLLETIRVLYELDLNRTLTARRLCIARRTLSGRLNRIRDLTGLDPTSTRGIQILYTALTAVSMSRAAGLPTGA